MDAKHYQIAKRFESEEAKLEAIARALMYVMRKLDDGDDESATLRYNLDQAFDFNL